MTGSSSGDGRDPAPDSSRNDIDTPNKDVVSRNSLDDEPWDVGLSPSTDKSQKVKMANAALQIPAPFMACIGDANELMSKTVKCFSGNDENLNEGELPSLRNSSRERPRQSSSLPRQNSSLLKGQQRTSRPLSPPSQRGLGQQTATRTSSISAPSQLRSVKSIESEKRGKFFKQLELSPSEVSETTGSTGEDDDDDGPDDEVAARHTTGNLDQPIREDETVEGDDSNQESRVTSNYSEGIDGVNCLDSALDALGTICGLTEAIPEQPKKERHWEQPQNGKDWLDVDGGVPRSNTDKINEQTAVEVEYMAPIETSKSTSSVPSSPPHKTKQEQPSAGWSPSKKNTYLAAMATKAKEDFENSQGATNMSMEERRITEEIRNSEESDDVYGSFNPAEKRTFLKLINGGMSSSDANKKIIANREENSQKKKKFIYFRRGIKSPTKSRSVQDTEEILSPRNENSPDSQMRTGPYVAGAAANKVIESSNFNRSGNNYYDSVRKEVGDDEEALSEDVRSTTKSPRLAKHASPKGFSPMKDREENESSFQKKGSPKKSRNVTLPEPTPKRRILGIPVPSKGREVGFSPLSDDTNGPKYLSAAAALAAVAHPVKKGSNEKELDNLERDLLRPMAMSTNLDQEANNDTSFDLVSPRELRDPYASGGKKVEVSAMDVDLDTYLDHSTTLFAGPNTAQDDKSFVSGKSAYTAGTNYSGYTGVSYATQSSRKRHRGAAKERMAKAKGDSSKKKGWHESIRAVAAESNRVWDPELGWVDYVERSTKVQKNASSEKLRVSLDGVTMLPSQEEQEEHQYESSQGSSVPVPFPPEWDKERNEMIHRKAGYIDSTAKSVGESARNEDELLQNPAATDDPYQDSAKLRQYNQSSESLEQEHPSSPHTDEKHNVASPKSRVEDFIEKSGVSRVSRLDYATVNSDQAVTSSEKEDHTADVPLSDTVSINTSVVSEKEQTSGKYMQLGDNGSVRSAYAQESSSRTATIPSTHVQGALAQTSTIEEGVADNDTAPLLQIVNEEMSASRAPEVNVVKEKCDETDMNFFASRGILGSFSGDEASILSHNRRKSKPVDLDALDDAIEDISSGEEYDDDAPWVYREAPGSEPQSSSLPSGDMTSSSKSVPIAVPKLGKSKKDTAPVHEELSGKVDASSATSSSVRMRTQRWESLASPESLPDPPEGEVQRQGGVDPPEVDWPIHSTDEVPISGEQEIPAEWKSFLGKKVRAESDAAAAKQEDEKKRAITYVSASDSESNMDKQGEDDSIFRFEGKGRSRDRSAPASGDEFPPDISPIQTEDEDEKIEMEMIEPSDTGAVEEATFLQRMTACAAPIMPRQCAPIHGDALPSAHLAFMRSNPSASGESPRGVSRFVPQSLCGRPDVISEENNTEYAKPKSRSTQSKSPRMTGSSKKRLNKNSKGTTGSDYRSSSSVTSDDFGNKAAYLDAIAMQTAISKPKRSGSRGKGRSTSSDISTGSRNSSSSEAWKSFLERKGAQEHNSKLESKSETTDVSKAAEKYAAEKVEEMMAVMSKRSKSTPKPRSTENDRQVTPVNNKIELRTSRSADGKSNPGKSDSALAAEELAAARVEAMMAAMSSSNLDEGEI